MDMKGLVRVNINDISVLWASQMVAHLCACLPWRWWRWRGRFAGSNRRHVRWLVWSLLTLTDRIRMRHCTGQPARPPNLAHVGVLVAGEMQWELVAGSACVPRAASQTVGQVRLCAGWMSGGGFVRAKHDEKRGRELAQSCKSEATVLRGWWAAFKRLVQHARGDKRSPDARRVAWLLARCHFIALGVGAQAFERQRGRAELAASQRSKPKVEPKKSAKGGEANLEQNCSCRCRSRHGTSWRWRGVADWWRRWRRRGWWRRRRRG